MFKFSDIVEVQEETEKGTAESICNAKANVNKTETEYVSVEDPLNIHRTTSNETSLVSDIPNIVKDENIIIAQGQGKTRVSILSDEFCEEQAFPYRLAREKFGYNSPRDIASDADYIFFAGSVYE